MGVVQLNGYLFWEIAPRSIGLLEAADDIIQRGRDPEVLLLQAKLFATVKIVVGVQNCTDGLSTLLICNRALVVATIELLEIKLSTSGFARPETQIVGSRGVKSRNWNIICNGLDDLTAIPDYNGLSLLILILSCVAVKLDLGIFSYIL